MRTGAIVGYLLWFTANFMFFAVSNVGNVMSTLVDPLLELVPGAFAGGMVAAVNPCCQYRRTVRRFDDPDLSYQHSGSGHILSLARQTHQRVLASTRIKTWVTPVMVLWAEFPQRVAQDRCVYVHGDELVAWLRARPQTIAPSRVHQVAQAVRASWERDGATHGSREGSR